MKRYTKIFLFTAYDDNYIYYVTIKNLKFVKILKYLKILCTLFSETQIDIVKKLIKVSI